MLSNQLPDHSRVWIYQADRFLSEDESASICNDTLKFLESWTAHQKDLLAWAEVRHGLFLILMTDEEKAAASGCSIDKSVHFVRELGRKHHVDFMNRMLFAYRNGDAIQLATRKEFESLVSDGIVHDDTIVFDNLVPTRKDLDRWEIPFRTSWHKQLV